MVRGLSQLLAFSLREINNFFCSRISTINFTSLITGMVGAVIVVVVVVGEVDAAIDENEVVGAGGGRQVDLGLRFRITFIALLLISPRFTVQLLLESFFGSFLITFTADCALRTLVERRRR
jgi:hypothetical protein